MALSHAKALLQEFQGAAQLYGAFSLTLGLVFGVMDGPPAVAPPVKSVKAAESLEELRKSIPEAPRELGFWRQFLVTTPAVALALRLGVKGQQLKAPPAAILLTMGPTLWAPLALYLVGYPMGIQLNQSFR